MAMTLLEKIIAAHSKSKMVKPGEIVEIEIDTRAARDFGGANVVGHLRKHNLGIVDPSGNLFTFDCNPTGSDQSYAANQHTCRLFAREHGIKVFDIDAGIGTHILIDEGYVGPGATAVSTDSHANILGAVGAFGQGMGDVDIAASWHRGKVWFRVPPSVKMTLKGEFPVGISAKDVILNLLGTFGASSLLGYSVEMHGHAADQLSLDARITISSMATEMGTIIILFPPSGEIIDYCSVRSNKQFTPVYADRDASYEKSIDIDVTRFQTMVSRPGEPHDTINIAEVSGQKIDSAFIGSCTNGRMADLHSAASVLRGRKVAPGVVLKIVPATDRIWKECLNEGIIEIFKQSGALVSNAGCAGCAAGQVGQNGPGEVTISTGNRNFTGKQGRGSVYLASPEVVAASAIAGFITTPDKIPAQPSVFMKPEYKAIELQKSPETKIRVDKPAVIEGRVWLVRRDNIDTDMIFHNRHLAITEQKEMGQYAFGNLSGMEGFSKEALPGDIIIAGKNFGSGSSRQQAVDCFISLGISAIVAESFGAIYERNAINAALPVITCKSLNELELRNGDRIKINLKTGEISNLRNLKTAAAEPFSEVQLGIYFNGGLLG